MREKNDDSRIINFRELLKRYEKFNDRIAFKYKEDGKIKEISYKTYINDIKSLAKSFLELDVKRVAVIGNNRYEWCVTYLATTTAGKIIVPLDKALTNNEIARLIRKK